MKVSVVIPAYNEERYIGSCLNSLLSQIERPDEIIVVDNHSNDKTLEVVKQFDVDIYESGEKGIIPTRNLGFDNAYGPIITRCDADCIVPADWIKKIKENFDFLPIDGLTGPIYYYDLSFKQLWYSKLFIYFMRVIQGYNTLLGPNMSITKKIWQKVRSKVCKDSQKVHEDIDLGQHIHEVNGIIKYDSSLIVGTSGRRIKSKPLSFFGEYPLRLFSTIRKHHS